MEVGKEKPKGRCSDFSARDGWREEEKKKKRGRRGREEKNKRKRNL